MSDICTITQATFDKAALSALLVDGVASGASVGFLAPLSYEAAAAYWQDVYLALGTGRLMLLGCYDQGRLVGSVQLDCATKENALHRAEVQKLFVLQSYRGQGIGASLMAAIERKASERGRWLLFLDTRQGDAAERLYTRLGYVRVGTIPNFAANSVGGYSATVFFYKELPHV